MGLNICWWADCVDGGEGYLERVEYYKTSPTQDLIDIAEDGGYVDDVPPVLEELYGREPAKAIELAESILANNKGDKILQEWVKEVFLDELK